MIDRKRPHISNIGSFTIDQARGFDAVKIIISHLIEYTSEKKVALIDTAEKIHLHALSDKGERLSVCFLPNEGMNFISYKKDDLEVIDLSTAPLFEERYAGLGAMIGPHFHHRPQNTLPKIKDESLFAHIKKVSEQKDADPFSHGIGRYAPWKVKEKDSTYIKAVLKGSDSWKGILLKELEGQDFKMEYQAKLLPQGLEIRLSVVSETESVVGLHTYYSIKKNVDKVMSRVDGKFRRHNKIEVVPESWIRGNQLEFPLDQEADFGFFPFPERTEGSIVLSNLLQVQYWCDSEENSWQLWHPKDASFVCVEPLSAKNPRKPVLSVSNLKILITIL